jgi:hypothetical protein
MTEISRSCFHAVGFQVARDPGTMRKAAANRLWTTSVSGHRECPVQRLRVYSVDLDVYMSVGLGSPQNSFPIP